MVSGLCERGKMECQNVYGYFCFFEYVVAFNLFVFRHDDIKKNEIVTGALTKDFRVKN